MLKGPLTRLRAKLINRWADAQGPALLHRRRIYILPSQLGLMFLLLFSLLMIAATNYSNALIFMLSFFMLAIFVNAIWQSHQNINGLSIKPTRLKPIYAGDHLYLQLLADAPSARFDIQLHISRFNSRSANIQSPLILELQDLKRGYYTLPAIKISSNFPFGLFTTWAWLNFDLGVWIYPRPAGTQALSSHHGNELDGKIATASLLADDYAGLKDYQSGEALSRVHWKSMAKTINTSQKIQSKSYEFFASTQQHLDIQDVSATNTEAKLSQLCQWILEMEERDQAYSLQLGPRLIPPGLGGSHKTACLQALAAYQLKSASA